MNDGGSNGASCDGTKVSTDTSKLCNIVIASFGDGRNLVGEGKMFIKDEAKTVMIKHQNNDSIFTAHRNARIASAVLATAIPSVCPSVCDCT